MTRPVQPPSETQPFTAQQAAALLEWVEGVRSLGRADIEGAYELAMDRFDCCIDHIRDRIHGLSGATVPAEQSSDAGDVERERSALSEGTGCEPAAKAPSTCECGHRRTWHRNGELACYAAVGSCECRAFVAVPAEPAWVDPACGCERSPDVAEGTPCPVHAVPAEPAEEDGFCPADPWCGCGANEECKRDKAIRSGAAAQDEETGHDG